MLVQLLSDLHLETETFEPEAAPGAELLVLAGDICSRWDGFELFRDWPVPVLVVPGNHEFDQRELRDALAALRRRCASLDLQLLERERLVLTGRDGRRIRFVATVRWSDFDVFGDAGRVKAMRAATYYVEVMRARCDGGVFDAAAVREESLACRAWLARELARLPSDDDAWDSTVAITHYAPSLRSLDPRYGKQPGTASFCNADDDLLPYAQVWMHGHLHCRHDYTVDHANGASTRVVSNARGHSLRNEPAGYDPLFVVEV